MSNKTFVGRDGIVPMSNSSELKRDLCVIGGQIPLAIIHALGCIRYVLIVQLFLKDSNRRYASYFQYKIETKTF